jgi:hypothetical protein
MGRKPCRKRALDESAIRADLPDVRIREELERRGVSAEFSGSVSSRLREIAGDLSAADAAREQSPRRFTAWSRTSP